MHDRVASTLALARTMLQGIDERSIDTLVRTASLKLVLDTLVELGSASASPLPNIKEPVSKQSRIDSLTRNMADNLAPFADHLKVQSGSSTR